MMSPDNNTPESKPAGKQETQNSGSRKTASTKQQEPALKCPRCDSPNTKFCYYNNYSLTQPRHFCKTCRRYWTRGGALRSVPIGGGCRKNKKSKSSSSRFSGSYISNEAGIESSSNSGLKFFQGLSPAMDFQLEGINSNNMPKNTPFFNHFSSFGEIPTTTTITTNFSLDPSPSSSSIMGFQELGGLTSLNVHKNFASSIESLSSINQDLHWKLQQQRLAMLFVGENQKENTSHDVIPCTAIEQKSQHFNLFQNLENSKMESCGNVGISKKDGGNNIGNLSTEWYFDNSYAPIAQTQETSSGNIVNENSGNWSNGINQAWSDLNRYTALP